MIFVIGTSVPHQWSCHVRCMHVAVGAVGDAKGGRKLRPVSLHFHMHLLWAVLIALCFMLYATILQITWEAQNSVYNCNIRAEQTATVAKSDASVVLVYVFICICVCNCLLISCNCICACIRAEYQYFYLYVYICICVCIRAECYQFLVGCSTDTSFMYLYFSSICVFLYLYLCICIFVQSGVPVPPSGRMLQWHIFSQGKLVLLLSSCFFCTVSCVLFLKYSIPFEVVP